LKSESGDTKNKNRNLPVDKNLLKNVIDSDENDSFSKKK
jgi:hypothetical protein